MSREKKQVPLEVMHRLYLTQWLDSLREQGSGDRALQRLREHFYSGEFEGYEETALFEIGYEDLLEEVLRGQNFKDYLSRLLEGQLQITPEILGITVGRKTYDINDLEGAWDRIKRLCLKAFGSDGFLPATSTAELLDRLKSKVEQLGRSRNLDSMVDIMRAVRGSLEEVFKFVADFLSSLKLVSPRSEREPLAKTVGRMVGAELERIDPSFGRHQALREFVGILQSSISEQVSKELENNCSPESLQEINKYISRSDGKPLVVHVLREIGNVAMHGNLTIDLGRIYASLLDDFIRSIESIFPEIAIRTKMEVRAPGIYSIGLCSRRWHKTFMYRSDCIWSYYKPLPEKALAIADTSDEKTYQLIECFVFPQETALQRRPEAPPLICERRVLGFDWKSIADRLKNEHKTEHENFTVEFSVGTDSSIAEAAADS